VDYSTCFIAMKIYLRAITLFVFYFSSLAVYAEQTLSSYEKALQLQIKGELKAAKISVKNSLQKNPRFLPARLLLGELLLASGQPQSAEKELTIALGLKADSSIVVIPLVKAKLFLYKYQAALSLLNQYPQLGREKGYYLLQGNAYKALRKYELAERSYQQSEFLHGETGALLIARADLLLKQNQLVKAEGMIDKALAIDISSQSAQMLKAEVLKKDADFASAFELYGRILQTDPNNKQALFASAVILLEQDKLSQALAYVMTLREFYPHDPYAKLLHSSVIALKGDKRQASNLLRDIQQQFLNLNDEQKENREVLLLSATVDYINGNYQQARQLFTKYLDSFGENLVARRHLASLAVKENNLLLAQQHIDKAISLSSNDVEVHLLGIHIYQKQESPLKYFTFVESAYQKFKDNSLVRDQYINALILLGRNEEAVAELAKVTGEGVLASQVLLGYLQLQNNKFKEAKSTTQHLLNTAPNKVEVLQLAGELSLKFGQAGDAETFFKQALSLDAMFRPALLSLAGMSLNINNTDKTIDYYQQLLTLYPNDAISLQLYANLAIKLQQPFLAIKLLSEIKAEQPQYAASQRALLALYLQTNQLVRAEEILVKLERRFSFDQQLLLAKSKLLAKQGNILLAAKTLKILFGLVYDDPLKIERIAALQIDLPDLPSAEKSIERLSQLTQGEVNSYIVARYALSNRDLNKAETIINKQQKKDIHSTAWVELNIHLLIAQNKLNEASLALELLYTDSKQRSHLQLLAQLYNQQGQKNKLSQLFASWLGEQPNDAWAVAQFSKLASDGGDIHKAINILESYPRIDQQALFLNNLANLYQEMDINKAISYAKKAYQLAGQLAAINDTLGWLLVQNNKAEQGLPYIRESIARDASNTNYLYHLAYTLVVLKRFDSAKDAFNLADKIAPDHHLNSIVNKMLINM